MRLSASYDGLSGELSPLKTELLANGLMPPRGEKDPYRRHECRVWLEAGVLPASTTTRSDWKTSKLLDTHSTQMSRRYLTIRKPSDFHDSRFAVFTGFLAAVSEAAGL